MKYIVYSVRDRLVGFGALLPDTSPENSKRNFALAMRSNPAADHLRHRRRPEERRGL